MDLPELTHENKIPSSTHKHWGGYILIQAINQETQQPDYLLNPYNIDDLQNRSMKIKLINNQILHKKIAQGKILNKYNIFPQTLTPVSIKNIYNDVTTGKKSRNKKNKTTTTTTTTTDNKQQENDINGMLIIIISTNKQT